VRLMAPVSPAGAAVFTADYPAPAELA